MWAACFSPVVEGTLHTVDGQVRVDLQRRFPKITSALLSLWTVTLTIWLGVLIWNITTQDEPLVWLLWWAILAGGTAAAPVVGGRLGGAVLDEALPELDKAARQPLVEEDW